MNSNDIKQVTLALNTEQATKKLSELTTKFESVRKLKAEAFEKGDAKAYALYTSEAKKLERQQERLVSRTQTVASTLQNLDRATPKDLQNTIREINRQLNSGSIARGSKEWNTLTAAMAEAKTELQKIKEEQKTITKGDGTSWLQSFGDKWQGAVVTFSGIKDTIAALTDKVMGFYTQYAQMAEHMSNVKKYTGLADEAVRQLNEDFKRMDTRTSREQLNDLAADAGRLGIQSRQQILDFVQAADQLNVALGEDLGEDGVKNIGKLAQLFGDADRMGLKQAMLATGSVINELAQSSSASEPYLMDFTARLAGVSKQAGLTQAQVLAFGSILDQSMVNVERGATALQNVIVALYANPTKMAKVAGLEVKQFSELLKKDGNAALLKFVEGLKSTGGMDKLAPLLKELKLSGAGVTQTLSALANNLQNLKKTQAQATTAFQQATSVTNEFNTANNTVQARLDKARKAATDMAVTLGEQLAPVAERILSTSTYFMSVLSTLATFIARNTKQIAAVTIAIAAYTVAINLAAIKTLLLSTSTKVAAAAMTAWNGAIGLAKGLSLSLSMTHSALTGNVTRLRAAQLLLNRTLIANPYVAVATAAVAAASAIYLWLTRERELSTEEKKRQAIQQDNMQLQQRANAATATTQARIQLLTAIIHDNNRKLSDRRAAVNALKKIIPEYNALINSEGRITRENTQAIKDYIKQLQQKAIIEAAQDKLKQIAERQIGRTEQLGRYDNAVSIKKARLHDFEQQNKEWLKSYHELEAEVAKGNTEAARSLGTMMLTSTGQTYERLRKDLQKAQSWVKDAKDDLNIYDAQSQSLIKTIERLGGKFEQIFNDSPTTQEDTGGGSAISFGKEDKETERRKRIRIANAQLDQQQRKEEAQAAVAFQTGQIKSYQLYQERLIDIDNAYIDKRLALYKAGDSEIATLQKQKADNEKEDLRLRQEYSLQAIDEDTQQQTQALKERYLRGEIQEKGYQTALDRIQEQRLTRRLKWLKDPANAADPKAIYDAEKQLQDLRNAQALTRLDKLFQQAQAMREEYLKKSLDDQEVEELELLDQLTEAFKWSQDERARYAEEIHKKYEKKREEEKDNNSKPDNKKSDDTSPLTGSTDAMSAAVINFARIFEQLQKKIDSGKATWQDYAAAGVAAVAIVTATMSSATQLVQANQQLEEARITKRYDNEIKAAAGNSKKKKKLEEQKEAELAKVKTKYNKKAMKIELAQATAQMAMSAILAFNDALQIGGLAGIIFAPIAAAAALAAGAIQIATIKKQHAAQAEGYYTGGFTPGRNYRQAAGIVHQGEFVANHQAVNNPALLPVLQLIDQAQRTNRVASLTPDDVSRAIAAPQRTAAATATTATATAEAATTAPQTLQIINTATDRQTDTLERLTAQLDRGITATVTIDGPNGLDRQYRRYQQLNNV